MVAIIFLSVAMRKKKKFLPHLMVSEVVIPPTGEWLPQFSGWSFIQLAGGAGYWMNSRGVLELATGAVLVLSPQAKGCIRASQIGQVVMQMYNFVPDRMSGLLSLREKEYLRTVAAQPQFAVRYIPPSDPLSSRFEQLFRDKTSTYFTIRLGMIQLFDEALGKELKLPVVEPAAASDAKGRLQELLEQTPASELLHLSFSDLVRKAQCTPRHFSRLIREELGMSFREKQSEIRLERACELLATTEAKMVDVALESGYQSLSLFNLMFKRRFGVSPGKWRASNQVATA